MGKPSKKMLRPSQTSSSAVDTIWFVIAGILVFFMQAGFGLLEAGFVRVKNTTNILMKNVLDASLGAVVWWAVGFGFAFGGSQGGFIGGDSFFPRARRTD